MKSNTKKRLIAFMLCMVLVLSSATSAFADEPQNTDSQSQAEVVTEPVADEATGDEANTTDIEIPSEKEWSVQVGNATVKVKGSADALPENAQLSVSEITSEDEVKEIEKAVEEKAIEEQFSIKNIFSYDIKFLVDGTEVQPTTPVQVSVDTPEITSDQNAAVLHVDDNNVAEDMNGAVDGEGKVVFDAPHFSKYVIVQKGDSEVTVTIEHYDNTKNPQEKIYADDVLTLPIGGKINDYTKATNWNVASVTKVETAADGTETTTPVDTDNEFSVTKDCTIKVYYTPKTKGFDGATTFYDYTVKAVTDDEARNNNNTYFSFNMLGEKPNNGRKLTAGTREQNFEQYKYWIPIGSFGANDYTKGTSVVKDILKGLDENGKVEFNYPEPGFFEDSDATCSVKVKKYDRFGRSYDDYETRYLRKVYKDLKLGFEQKGDTYTLKDVKDQNGKILTTEGAGFYPLENERKFSYENSEKAQNYFFGMRYDVLFKIGDYVGPMNYEFTGDDDLWVLLDGKVVLDLGGIHQAASETVDIWEKLGKTADELTPEGKEKEHTLTVLYMERGAGESNCKMKFTLPSASIAEVSQVPMAELNLQKVNKNNEGLQDARFTLVNNETGETQTASSVGESGNVRFTKLRVGTYTLREDAAPSGYIPSLDTWIVKVELDSNNTAIATLYLSDGTTKYTDKEGSYYQILNMTKEELINSSLNYNKTAKVIDWDKRTYQIDISAASKLTSTTSSEQAAVADVMMVFDTLGSMLYDSNDYDSKGFKKVGPYKDIRNTLDTTKVTLSAGNKGTINGQAKEERDSLVAGSTVTFNLKDVQVTDDKYYVKGIRLSGRDNEEALASPVLDNVTGDADYVVAYGIKKDMVAYTVNYQDASGKALAESQTFYGNVGDKPIVAYQYIENYIPDALALTKTLSNNESENVFTFTYKPGATDRVVTTTTTITTTVPGTATPGTGTGNVGTAGGTTGGTTGGTAGTTGGTTTGTTSGTTTGTTGGTTDGTTTGTTDGTMTDNNSQDTTAKDKDTATSGDEQTPKSLVDLDDEDTPKGNIDAKDKTSKTPIAAGIGIIVVAVAALVGLIVFLKKRAK